jgi:hypothetical protein
MVWGKKTLHKTYQWYWQECELFPYKEECVLPNCEMDTVISVTWLNLNFGVTFSDKVKNYRYDKIRLKTLHLKKKVTHLGWELRRFRMSKCSEIHISTRMISLGFKFWFNPVRAIRKISVLDVFVLWKTSERNVCHRQSTFATNSLVAIQQMNLAVNHEHALMTSSNNNQK